MKFANMKVKTILLAAVIVAVLTVGMAYAGGQKGHGGHGGRRMWGPHMGGGRQMERGCCFEAHGRGGRGFAKRGFADKNHADREHAYKSSAREVPQEIRDKWAEAQKTGIDLRMELGKNPVNREKALELHAKRRALMQEISDWNFNRKLDALAADKADKE